MSEVEFYRPTFKVRLHSSYASTTNARAAVLQTYVAATPSHDPAETANPDTDLADKAPGAYMNATVAGLPATHQCLIAIALSQSDGDTC